MIVVVILLIIVVIVLGVWGAIAAAGNAATAATALTLATTSAVSQTTILALACALLASLPLLVYGAFRLGALRAERRRDGTRTITPAPAIRWIEGTPVTALPRERIAVLQLPEPQSELTAIVPLPRVKRASRHTRQAARVAQR